MLLVVVNEYVRHLLIYTFEVCKYMYPWILFRKTLLLSNNNFFYMYYKDINPDLFTMKRAHSD